MEIRIGEVTHFYSHLCVAVLELSAELKIGDLVHVQGKTTDFIQRVKSMEIEHHPIQSAASGQQVALKVFRMVRRGDMVFKISGDEAEEAALDDAIALDSCH